MAFKLAALSIFALSFAVVFARPHEGLFDCAGKLDGAYADPTDNTGYYVCIDEKTIARLHCRNGDVFDGTLGNCVGDKLEVVEDEGNDQEDIQMLKSELMNALNGASTKWPEDGPQGNSKYKVYNIQFTKNVFPESVLVIERAQREQKNK